MTGIETGEAVGIGERMFGSDQLTQLYTLSRFLRCTDINHHFGMDRMPGSWLNSISITAQTFPDGTFAQMIIEPQDGSCDALSWRFSYVGQPTDAGVDYQEAFRNWVEDQYRRKNPGDDSGNNVVIKGEDGLSVTFYMPQCSKPVYLEERPQMGVKFDAHTNTVRFIPYCMRMYIGSTSRSVPALPSVA